MVGRIVGIGFLHYVEGQRILVWVMSASASATNRRIIIHCGSPALRSDT
jgi:hypothetical protein